MNAPIEKRMLFHNLNLLFLIGILFLFLVSVFQIESEEIDDAFISFRYAENFAQGKGLVFNSGERVEGYSNFLWVILLGLLPN